MSTHQTFLLLVACILLITFLVSIISRWVNRHQLYRKMEELWRYCLPIETFIRPNSRFDYQYETYQHQYEPESLIDDKTWSDLNMDNVFNTANFNLSAIGEMRFYASLRGMFHITNAKILTLFNEHDNFRQKVSYHLALLGKTIYPMFPDQITSIQRNKWLMLCPFLPFITFAIIFIEVQTGVLLFLASIMFNIVLSARLKRTYEDDLKSLFYSSNVLQQSYAISKLQDAPQPNVDFKHFKVARRFTGVLVDINEQDIGGAVIKLIKLTFMLDYVLFHAIQKSYHQYIDELMACYDYLGMLDNHYSLALYRRTLENYCEPEVTNNNQVEFTNLTHPLLDEAVPNDFNWSNHILLTGSNASGKSTFMKAVAINLILAQSINTVMASTFKYQPGYVLTSMANADDVLSGESYFMAELKSIKRIVALSTKRPVYCFIDEIFKGTNTTERIAASESVLTYLQHQSNFNIIAATHDIELADLLHNTFNNYHFNEVIEANEIHFDYKIKPGKANTRNAIELLRITEFPQSIYQRAKNAVT